MKGFQWLSFILAFNLCAAVFYSDDDEPEPEDFGLIRYKRSSDRQGNNNNRNNRNNQNNNSSGRNGYGGNSGNNRNNNRNNSNGRNQGRKRNNNQRTTSDYMGSTYSDNDNE